MNDSNGFDFTKFVPGFDFLKNMSGNAAAAAPAHSSWVAPTLDPAELDKRIQELKTVHFWLDQNTKAVSATIQALEVQRMTLSALQNMNVSFGEMADALKIKPHHSSKHASHDDAQAPATAHAPTKRKAKSTSHKKSKSAAKPAAGADPSQWWGALTEQFQTIANTAMHEMAKNAQHHPGAPATGGKAHATDGAKSATKAQNQTASQSSNKASAPTAAAKRTAATRKRSTPRSRSR